MTDDWKNNVNARISRSLLVVCFISSVILSMVYYGLLPMPPFLKTKALSGGKKAGISRVAKTHTKSMSPLARFLEEKQYYSLLFNEAKMKSVLKNETVQTILDAQMESEYLEDNPEAMNFVRQRDLWRNASIEEALENGNESVCKNCAINSSCYNASMSLWHPTKCPLLKHYSPENAYKDEKCFNLSMMVMGDSRARMLYLAVLRRFYPDWKLISR